MSAAERLSGVSVMAKRWPVRVGLFPGESLSSWLRRSGQIYGCSAEQLLKYDFGSPGLKKAELDMSVPRNLLEAISERAGVSVASLARTTFSLTVPFLVDGEEIISGDIEDCSVLDESSNCTQRSLAGWIRWFRRGSRSRITACRLCLSDFPNSPVLLSWGLSVMSSCPVHGLLLERASFNGESIHWLNARAEAAPDLVSQLDRRTQAALTEGVVQLPGGEVTAFQWFRLLSTIFLELNTVVIGGPRKTYNLCKLWRAAEYYPGVFDRQFVFDKTSALLIAMAIDMMERGAISPAGEFGYLFKGDVVS